MKHLALCLVIDHLKKKEAPFCVIDAHGGPGLYNLHSEQALKTREWETGIGRFDDILENNDFKIYYDLARDDLAQKTYPGSPMLIARMLRANDRMIANELHPEDFETLRQNLKHRYNARVTHLDAYECIRANVPPAEKRGLVLIDPPFESKDEFETLVKQMKEWKKRFANGVFILWYPIKAHLAIDRIKEAATELGMPRTWCFEAMRHPRNQPESFNGSGLLIFNTPFQIPERITALMPLLSQKMGLIETPSSWLVSD